MLPLGKKSSFVDHPFRNFHGGTFMQNCPKSAMKFGQKNRTTVPIVFVMPWLYI